MSKIQDTEHALLTPNTDYSHLLNCISQTWEVAKSSAAIAVNTQLLEANWKTGKYIVGFEQGGKERAEYGRQLLVNLAKDLTALLGKGFNRTNLSYMRKLYLAFPICGTLSRKLTWSHYYELLKSSSELELQFYYKPTVCGQIPAVSAQEGRAATTTQQFAYQRY